jgi:hypothetical protein
MLDWKVLGKHTLPVGIQDAWTDQLRMFAEKSKDGERFLRLLDQADIAYKFDTIRELHVFLVKFSPEMDMKELEYFRDQIEVMRKKARVVMVSLEGEKQNSTVVISADQEWNEYKVRNEERIKEHTDSINFSSRSTLALASPLCWYVTHCFSFLTAFPESMISPAL